MIGKPATPEAYQLFHEGVISLAQVEANGIRVDMNYLNRTIEETSHKMKVLERELRDDPLFDRWRRRFGSKAKLSNRKQLGTIIFDELGHKRKVVAKKYKFNDDGDEEKDKESNDEAAFESVDLPFVKKYFELAKLDKARGTYLNGIRREVAYDGLLHPFFGLHIARSYRGNSEMPNFQNIPIRNPEMRALIRRAFIARKHHRLVEIDISGAEVRVAGCYCKDPVLLDYIFHSPPKDMHRDMAQQIFFLKEQEVDKKTTRDCSKNKFVFPEFYGSVYFNCARDIWEQMHIRNFKVAGSEELVIDRLKKHGITKLGSCDPTQKPRKGTFEKHLQEVEQDFWGNRFKAYADWKKRFFRTYQSRGWYDTLTGFHIEGIWGRNDVTNYPIQGSAFHCLLWSLNRLQYQLRKYRMKSLIVGQIHDSIVADVHEDELHDFLEMVVQIMTVDLPKAWKWIIVPIEIEADVVPEGKSWYDKQAVDLHNIQGISL